MSRPSLGSRLNADHFLGKSRKSDRISLLGQVSEGSLLDAGSKRSQALFRREAHRAGLDLRPMPLHGMGGGEDQGGGGPDAYGRLIEWGIGT
jgi:hypothetical protein